MPGYRRINGRTYSSDALETAARTHAPTELLVRHGDVYRTIAIPYYDGPRYPHLARIEGVPDRLSDVVKPRS